MNKKQLKKALSSVRLPDTSREKIIRNLERFDPDTQPQTDAEAYVFEVAPAKTPVLRYAITSLAACAVLAFTAVGIYTANKGALAPVPEVSQSMNVSQGVTVNLFSESPLFAVMGVDMSEASETVAYQVLTEEQKCQLSGFYNALDWDNPVQPQSYIYDEPDVCRLYFQHDSIWNILKIVKDENGQGWIKRISQTDAGSEMDLIQADGAVIDEIRSIISDDGRTNTVSMDYYDAVYDDPFALIEPMCCDVAYNELITLSVELDADGHQACFMTLEDGNMTNDASRSGKFYFMDAEQKQELAALNLNKLLMNMQYYSNLRMEYSLGGTIQDVLYLDTGTYLEFWKDSGTILIHGLPSVPGEDFALEIDASLMEQYCTLFEGFKEDSACVTTDHLSHETIMETMFINSDMPQVIEQAKEVFCNLDQAELYFNNEASGYLFEEHYPSRYYSISQEKQQALAELFAGLPYDDMKEHYTDGGYNFVMYLQDKNLKQSFVNFLFYPDFDCAYMSWHPDGMSAQSNYYLELDLDTLGRIAEIISEPEQLFLKENSLFEFDDNMFSDTKEMLTEASVQYGAYLNEYNQTHGTQLRFPTADECLEAGISEYNCFHFFRTEFPDKEAFFRYVDILVERGETVISNFHRVDVHGNYEDETEVTGYIYYSYNASGQTYGTMGFMGACVNPEYPDLIAVMTEEGVQGYITKEDCNRGEAQSLEEAAAYTEEIERRRENGIMYIPVDAYASDGKTVVGTFHIDCLE